jgi:hypothetical protein
MTHSNLVANELKNAGFRTRVLTSNAVEVSLNRKISTLEVLHTTDKLFDEIKFNAESVNGKVILSW